jgi:hypothetical protein
MANSDFWILGGGKEGQLASLNSEGTLMGYYSCEA